MDTRQDTLQADEFADDLLADFDAVPTKGSPSAPASKWSDAENKVEPKSSSAAIKWPTLPLNTSEVDHQHLVLRLTEITSHYRTHHSYATVRSAFVETSLLLNQLGLLAPAFREQPSIPRVVKARTNSHTQLLIDQIVIDCHWLHSRGEKVQPRWNELRRVFSSRSKFNCSEIAERLAAKNWKTEFRANDLLLLNDRQQMQLAQLCTAAKKEARRTLFEGSRDFGSTGMVSRIPARVTSVRLAINNWADRTHQIQGHEDMYQALWVARELLGPAASHPQIAEFAGLQCGCPPLHPRTASEKLRRLQEVLAGS
ncbi:hypothetical protein [Variovorax soli]|uniref:Uncharacterized protein n=1 Tax=Variovorax soli TaxID=376815 RepID=A0ABU1NLY4_9BURK|nr:hypothetical protein [Variovorax soli]MDR6539474.1 hypothetical protein [Variovorax soli]